MFKLKFVLPMLAFVLAIGMSFAFVNADETAIQGYIETSPGMWTSVNVDCEEGINDCRVYFSSDPSTIYPVYPVPNPDKDDDPLKSSSLDPIQL